MQVVRERDEGAVLVAVEPQASLDRGDEGRPFPPDGERDRAGRGEQGASTWWQHFAQCLLRDGNASRSLAQDTLDLARYTEAARLAAVLGDPEAPGVPAGFYLPKDVAEHTEDHGMRCPVSRPEPRPGR